MKTRILLILCSLVLTLSGFGADEKSLAKTLREYTEGQEARIGVAVIINDTDTVAVNGKQSFPMMSVFKFPLALAVAYVTDSNGGSLNDSITFDLECLKEDTYSPMFRKYGKSRNTMAIRELLEWSLMESDNNAADILLDYVEGPAKATSIMRRMGLPEDITIGASEDDMHRNPDASNLNRATPLAMADLFNRFYCELRNSSASYSAIAAMLENCCTGLDRLAKPLSGTDAKIGHKTGTGFQTPDGRITALNDCGYVSLPNRTHYSIAVFIADSKLGMEATSAMIATISKIVGESLGIQRTEKPGVSSNVNQNTIK